MHNSRITLKNFDVPKQKIAEEMSRRAKCFISSEMVTKLQGTNVNTTVYAAQIDKTTILALAKVDGSINIQLVCW